MYSIIYTTIFFPIIISYRIISYVFFNWKWNSKITNNLYISWWYIIWKDLIFIENEDIDVVINLAKELFVSNHLKESIDYYEFDVMDWWVPSKEDLIQIEEIYKKEKIRNSKIQVNCAFGSWRSAFVILYLLIKNNEFNNLNEAYSFLKKIRPQVWLNKYQMKKLKEYII